jgi:Xaa-Pro aminopeptidase
MRLAVKTPKMRLQRLSTSFVREGLRRSMTTLEYEIRKRGGNLAFETKVDSRPRSAIVHGRPSNRTLQEGDFLLIDYGARVDGYNSDITRTYSIGEPSDEMVKVYEVVLKAQTEAKNASKAGVIGSQIHEVAASIIREAGYANIRSRPGHCLGMDTHDGQGAFS